MHWRSLSKDNILTLYGRAANRHLKRIHYGNRTPLLDGAGRRPRDIDPRSGDWMFEIVFDYGHRN